jgi:hypothetical protein
LIELIALVEVLVDLAHQRTKVEGIFLIQEGLQEPIDELGYNNGLQSIMGPIGHRVMRDKLQPIRHVFWNSVSNIDVTLFILTFHSSFTST